MKLTDTEKLKLDEAHIINKKSLSHICERYEYKDASKLKYWINLYKQHRKKFLLIEKTE